MAPIETIFGPNESQRCQLKFEKFLGQRKNFREGENFEKLSRKVRKSWPGEAFSNEKQNRNGQLFKFGKAIQGMATAVWWPLEE